MPTVLPDTGAPSERPLQPASTANTKHGIVNPRNKLYRRWWIELPCGFIVLVLSLLTGEEIKSWLHQPVPGNVLGLFILLICFRLRLIPPHLVEEAANRLLFVLPALFIPIYVSAIGQGELWSQMSWVFLPLLFAATAGLWIFVGHLAQRLFRGPLQNE